MHLYQKNFSKTPSASTTTFHGGSFADVDLCACIFFLLVPQHSKPVSLGCGVAGEMAFWQYFPGNK